MVKRASRRKKIESTRTQRQIDVTILLPKKKKKKVRKEQKCEAMDSSLKIFSLAVLPIMFSKKWIFK